MRLSQVIDLVRRRNRSNGVTHEATAGFPTRRQWFVGAAGAAIGGTALAADSALRPTAAFAQTGNFVDVTSNQTIGGIKTFTEPPVVPAGTFALTQVPGTAMVAAAVTGPFAPSSPGALAPTRYVGGTTSGAPSTGTFAMGDFVIDQTGKLWICTLTGSPGTWVPVVGVDLTSNQTVGGVKTFTAAPVVPAGAFPQTAVDGLATDLAAKAPAAGPFAPSTPGATAATRYVGGTGSGAPITGTFAVGDFVIDQTGKMWICTAAGSPGTWAGHSISGVDLSTDQTIAGVKTFTQPPIVPAGTFALPQVPGTAMVAANVTGPFAPSTPGATAATRYVGGTQSGAPTTGTFAVGDFVIDQTGKMWICTAAGSPGTWVQQAGAGVDLTSDQTVGGIKTFSVAPVVPMDSFPQGAVAGLVADLAAKQAVIPEGTYASLTGGNVGTEPAPAGEPWLKFTGTTVPAGIVLAVDNTLLDGLYPRAPRVLEIDARGNIVSQGYLAVTGDMNPLLSKPAAMIQARSDLGLYDSSYLAQSNVSPQYLFIGGTRSVCRFAIGDDGRISWMSGAWPTTAYADQPWEAHIAYAGINTLNVLGNLAVAPANVAPFVASNYNLNAAHGSGLLCTRNELRPSATTLIPALTFGSALNYNKAPLGVLHFASSGPENGHRTLATLEGAIDGATANQRGGAIVLRTKPNGVANTLLERLRVTSVGVVSIGGAPGASATAGEIEQTGAGKGHIMTSPDGTRYRLAIANGGTLSVTAA